MYFSTLSVPESQRLGAWQAALRSTCGEVATDPGRSHFEGSLDIRVARRFGMMRVTHTAREGLRGEREIAGHGADKLFFGLQVAGKTRIEHAGRSLCLNPGDLTVMDGSQPLRAVSDRKNTQFLMYVAREDLACLDIDWDAQLLRVVPRHFAPLLGSFLQSVFDHIGHGDDYTDEAIYQSVRSLIRAAWGTRAPQDEIAPCVSFERVDRFGRLLSSIQQYIGSRLADETLSPAVIAEAFRMSERQLHRVLATTGQSVGRIIRRARLDRCAADLRDPAHQDRSITDIAFGWGFNDAAHFSRQFRAEFDQSPSEYRVAARMAH